MDKEYIIKADVEFRFTAPDERAALVQAHTILKEQYPGLTEESVRVVDAKSGYVVAED